MLKRNKPITPGMRGYVNVDRSDLHKGRPHKSLTASIERSYGRNHFGRITTRHRSGGHKKLYRFIDFTRDLYDVPGVIERVEYDPNRSVYIALIKYPENHYRYILYPQGLKIGDQVISSKSKVDVSPGNSMPLKLMPVGVQIHNVEIHVGKGGKIARAAGVSCTLMAKDSVNATLRLSSGETRYVNVGCCATVGVLSNSDHKNKSDGKAGRSRWKGIRPTVRGVAMNPVDHPHGGGEGKTSGGRHPVSPWGLSTKGKKTRNNKRTQNMIIRSRRQK